MVRIAFGNSWNPKGFLFDWFIKDYFIFFHLKILVVEKILFKLYKKLKIRYFTSISYASYQSQKLLKQY